MQHTFHSTVVKQQQIVILGAGIVGLSCAVRLLNKYPTAELQIIGEQFSPYTTSDVAAGLWGPYVLGGTPELICRKWAQDTHDYMHTLWRNGEAARCGICLVPVFELFETEEHAPWWHDIVFGFQSLDQQYKKNEMLEQKYRTCMAYITFTCEPTKLMSYYRKVLMARNVRFTQARFNTIDDLATLRLHSNVIIINCLGLGAKSIVDDSALSSVRGQVQKVSAEGVFHSFANDGSYIIPNTDTVTLGGTKQKSDSVQVCPVDRYNIRKNCFNIIPSLKNALVIRDAVGLRPARLTGVRLEVGYASVVDGTSSKQTIVHNYGHGGAGISLAWGCAGEVVRLVEQETTHMESKF